MCTILLITLILSNSSNHSFLDEESRDTKEQEMIEIIVHLRGQADLTKLPPSFSKNDKINHLKEFARFQQKDLLDFLANFTLEVAEIQTYWLFNGLYLKTTRKVIEQIAKRNDVSYITENCMIYLDSIEFGNSVNSRALGYNIRIIKADSCWNEGFDGTGVIIGNIDSGVDTSHPALRGKWYPGGWYDGINYLPGPYDDHGHGTFTMGIICGGDANGPFVDDIGVAPGVRFIVAKAFDSTGAAPYSVMHNCLQWFATQNAKIINNPWNEGGTNTSLEFWNDCLNLLNLGILLVFKGGALPGGLMRTPGNFPIVIAMGTTDSLDNIASYSAHGPAPNQNPWNDSSYWFRNDWNLIKPDIAAPGHNIRSASLGGGYEFGNGTSWAATHVTGACAILLQRDSILTPAELYNTLLNNADHPPQGGGYPNMDYGWGRLNIYSALHSLAINEKFSNPKPLPKVSIYPNPFTEKTVIKYQTPDEKVKTFLRIYDTSGRIVKDFTPLMAEKFGKFIWDGKDNNGRGLPAGVYVLELSISREVIHSNLIFIR